MDRFQQQKQKAIQIINRLGDFARKNDYRDLLSRINEITENLEKEKLLVVVCGEFKQGKSRLINALLEEPGLFPVNVDIATNLVTTITFGEKEEIKVILGEPGNETEKIITRDEIAEYVTEQKNRKNKHNARLLIIQSPNVRLKTGLTLADTPGIGGLNIKHTDMSYAFIPNADVVIFVSDVHAPLSSEDLEFVEKRIAKHCQEIITVVTKIDEVSDYKVIVDSNREKLSQTLGQPKEKIKIIPVSSKNKEDYLKTHDDEDLMDSNFVELEKELWNSLAERRGNILLINAMSKLIESVGQIAGPLKMELEACKTDNKKYLDELERQLNEAREWNQTLIEKDAEWRIQLNRGLDDIGSAVTATLQNGFIDIRQMSQGYLDDPRYLEKPDTLVGMLEVEVDSLMSAIGRQLSEQTSQLQSDIEAETTLKLDLFKVEALEINVPIPEIRRVAGKRGTWANAIEVTRRAGFDATAGSTIAGVVGATIGGIIGSFFGGIGAYPGAIIGSAIGGAIGGIGGATNGARQALSQIKEREIAQIRLQATRIVQPFLDRVQATCIQSLKDVVKDLQRSMQDDLLKKIRQARKSSEETLKSIQETRNLSHEQRKQKAIVLQGKLQQLELIRQQSQAFAEEVLKQDEPKTEKQAA